jgi:hypothetical protein
MPVIILPQNHQSLYRPDSCSELADGERCENAERNQKTNGARRSMWGEDGNDVRPYQVKG